MNKLLLALCFQIICLSCWAEDFIVFRNGSVVKANVYEIGQTEIRYRKASNPDGPIYTVSKKDIFSINYSNGEKDIFEDTAQHDTLNARTDKPSFDNDSLISIYNAVAPKRRTSKKSNGKPAKSLYVFWGLDSSSIISTTCLNLTFSREINPIVYAVLNHNLNDGIDGYNYAIKLYNKSSHTIYIDLANTFRVNNTDNESNGTVWFENKTITETRASGKSLSTNVIAGLLGITGLSMNSYNNNGVSVSTTDQRVIAIPPSSSVTLPGHAKLIGNEIMHFYEDLDIVISADKKRQLGIMDWQTKTYTPGELPYSIKFYITYSTEADFSSYDILPVSLYIKSIYGVRGSEHINSKNYDIRSDDFILMGYIHEQ